MNYKIKCTCYRDSNWDLIENTIGGNYIRCRICGYQRQEPLETLSVNETFELAQKKFHGEESLVFSPLFKFLEKEVLNRRIKVIKKKLSKGKIIEVGPGNGSFLDKATKVGYEVYAVEHSKSFAEKIKNSLNIPVWVGKFEEYSIEEPIFDAFLSFHVIEHVPDVLNHLKKANEIVKGGGFAFIATPNGNSWEQKVASRDSPNYCTSHLHLFTEKSLSFHLNQTGWDLIFVSTPSYMSSWPRVLSSFLRRRETKTSKTPSSGGKYIKSNNSMLFLIVMIYGFVTKPFRLMQEFFKGGNELFIIAQKNSLIEK